MSTEMVDRAAVGDIEAELSATANPIQDESKADIESQVEVPAEPKVCLETRATKKNAPTPRVV